MKIYVRRTTFVVPDQPNQSRTNSILNILRKENMFEILIATSNIGIIESKGFTH